MQLKESVYSRTDITLTILVVTVDYGHVYVISTPHHRRSQSLLDGVADKECAPVFLTIQFNSILAQN
jgi:hypothetical protein